MQDQKVHEGRNVKRFREMLGIKQDKLASDLCISQQSVSQIEQRETLEPEMLDQVARALGISKDAIRNFNEEAAISIISNTFNDQAVSMNYKCTINPVDKWFEATEEIKNLYVQLLKEKDEKIALQQTLIEKYESLLKGKKR